MKSKVDPASQRILLLVKLDAQRLYDRVKYRAPDYIGTFALKRTREHFTDIFKNRYQHMKIDELNHCGEESIIALDKFYTAVDDIHWYLNHTEDMPKKVEDNINAYIRDLDELIETVNLYINAELGYQEEE